MKNGIPEALASGMPFLLERLRMGAAVVGLLAIGSACVAKPGPVAGSSPQRIVSLAPSLTESLLALDLADRIVGVTRYCPEVGGAVRVGGYFDPSLETIVALDPDLVVLMQSHDELRRRFSNLGLETLQVDQHDVQGVLSSLVVIAERCGVGARGRLVRVNLESALAEVSTAVAGLDRPRTLVVVGREPGSGRIGTVWAAAPDTFYDDVVRLAGGANVIEDTGIRYPELGREGLLALDPDVILDVLADGGARGLDLDAAAGDWFDLDDVSAVRAGKVHLLTEDYVMIPGPRIVETVRSFARRLHPEVAWP
jgi:iron complex transport system substrate-binding protein